MARKSQPRRGTILVLSAMLMVVLLLMVACAIDLGYVVVVRTELQAAADAGSLAGCSVLKDGPAAAKAEAKKFADLNLAKSNTGVTVIVADDVQLGYWDPAARTFQVLTGVNEDQANAVRVTCRMTDDRGTAANLFFGRVVGKDSADVEATAVARAKSVECGKFIGTSRVIMSGTSYVDSYYSDSGAYSAGTALNNGDVCSNGPIGGSDGTEIRGDASPGVGNSVLGNVAVTGSTDSLIEPLNIAPIDMSAAALSNDNTSIPLTTFGRDPLLSSGDLQMVPGDSVTLPAGTYYLNNMILGSGATISFSGQTVIYVQGNIYANGGAILNQTGIPRNLQIYSNGTVVSLSGNAEMHGVVYAPNARISRSSTTDFYGMLLGYELALSGFGGLHADDSLGVLYGVRTRSVLVE